MEDKIISLSEVTSALAEYKAAVEDLGKKLTGGDLTLETNKTEVNSAWQSDNASTFIANYTNLITYITEAYNSLVKYQDKIQGVVNEFVGFDTTIENE